MAALLRAATPELERLPWIKRPVAISVPAVQAELVDFKLEFVTQR